MMCGQPIRVLELDPNFKQEVIAQEPVCDVSACFSCGTCTGGCPIHAVYPEHDPRKIVRMINLGMKERVLSNPYIWNCSECDLCEQNCPQRVKFSSVRGILKDMVLKEGYTPPVSINEDMCSGCGICAALCPYEAMEFRMEDGNRVVHLVNAASCRGCGVCGAACPSGAISIKRFEDEEIFCQLEESVA